MTSLRHDFDPLPPFTDPRAALRRCLPALRPAESISVTEAAEKYVRVRVAGEWLPFRRDVAPYMVEPTDMIASRDYAALAFCGPSQSGKTQMLQTALAYTIMSDPGRVALFQMSREAAAEMERDKISPMIRNSAPLHDRQGTGRGSDNMYQKLFIGGTHLTLDWPTITKLSSATIRLVMGTDYDHFDESIGGEGDAYSLMRARTRTFMSRGMVVVESSPAKPIVDEGWRAQTPHDCPPVRHGVLSLYPRGTRGRWYWPCPHCDDEFEPTFTKLRYPKNASPSEAGEAAEMECPHCHALVAHSLKRELNAAGRWLHETANGELVPIDSGEVRKTDLLSYWLNGAAASFATWAELVAKYEEALAHFDLTGDEGPLQTTMNTGQAQPYLPRGARSENEITLQGLKDKVKAQSIKTPKGTAPDWTRYLLVAVDTQGNRWDVSVIAFGDGGRHMPIDRFEIFEPPAEAPAEAGKRTVRPGRIAEDWAALEPLADKTWPVEGMGYALRAHAIAVDMQGEGATTDNAYRFYRGRRQASQGRLWFLTRGQGGPKPDRVWLKEPERASQASGRRRKAATDIKIVHMATDRLKDSVATSLLLLEDAQNLCCLPEWMTEAQLIEATAERRLEKGWDKRPGMVRNETLDHLVQARALHILLKGEKIDPASPPAWARSGPDNENAVQFTADVPEEKPAKPRPASKQAPKQIKYLRR